MNKQIKGCGLSENDQIYLFTLCLRQLGILVKIQFSR